MSRLRSVLASLHLVTIILLLCAPAVMRAVPAPDQEYEYTQPDGTKFKARPKGDEWFHWHETPEGRPIGRDAKTKQWRYAMPAEEGLGPVTGGIVAKEAPRVQPWTPKAPAKALQERARKPVRSVPIRKAGAQRPEPGNRVASGTSGGKQTRSGAAATSAVAPSTGEAIAMTGTVGTAAAALTITEGKIAIFLTTFADRVDSEVTDPAYYENLLFDGTAGARSMVNFYKDVSKGQFTVSSGPEGISGWWIAPENHAYYGANTTVAQDEKSPELVLHTVAGADEEFDFGPYDTDNDGFVDLVAIVHQGNAEAFGGAPEDIWPHKWSFTESGGQAYTTNDRNANGVIVKINDYFITSEINNPNTGATATMGVFAHEYGHALGLPDLYDRDRTASAGLGSWCVMAGGSNNNGGATPAFMSAWCRWELGWTAPEVVSYNQRQRELPDVKDKDEVLLLWKNGVQGDEYFLVENRQRTGWDSALPAGGLLIFHCDDSVTTQNDRQWWWTGSEGSTRNGHYLVALEQADGQFNLERVGTGTSNSGDAGDPFVQGREFDSYTLPSSRAYSSGTTMGDIGPLTHVAVKNISPAGKTMKADFFIDEDRSFPEVTITSPLPNTLYNQVTEVVGYASAVNLKHVKVALQENRPGGRWWHWGQNAWGSTTFNEAAHTKIATGTSNWSITFGALADGAYHAFAKAVDQNDSASEYVSVSFTVQADTSAPSITIENPAQDAVLANAPIVSGTAQDNAGLAEKRIALWSSAAGKWFRWSTGVFEDVDFSFETSVNRITSGDTTWALALPANLAQGRYEVHAQAVDTTNQGSAWVSRAFSLVYKPVVTLTAPESGLFSNAFPEIRGTAVDKSGTGLEGGRVLLTIYRDGNFWNGTAWQVDQTSVGVTVQGDGTWAYPANAANSTHVLPTGSGFYAINVSARDNAGNWSEPVAPGNPGTNQITIDIDSDPPDVEIASPVANAVLRQRIPSDDWFYGIATDERGRPEVTLFIKRVDDGTWWTGSGWHWNRDSAGFNAVFSAQAGPGGNDAPASQTQWLHPGRMPHIGLHADCMRSGAYELTAVAKDRAGNERQVTTVITVDYTVPLPNEPVVRTETPAVNEASVSASTISPMPRDAEDDQYHNVPKMVRDAAGNVYSLAQRSTRPGYQFGPSFPTVWLLKHNAAGELQWKLERQQRSVTVTSQGLESTTHYEKFSDADTERLISAVEYGSYYTAGDLKIDAMGNVYVALNVATLQYVQYAISASGSPLFHYAPVPVAWTVIYKFGPDGRALWRRVINPGQDFNWHHRNFVKSMEVLSTGEVALLLDNSTYNAGSQWSPSYVVAQTVVAVIGESTGWVARRGYGAFQSDARHLGVDAQDNVFVMSDESDTMRGKRKTLRKFSRAGQELQEVELDLCDLPEDWDAFDFDPATGALYFGGGFVFPSENGARQVVTKVDLSLGSGEQVIAWRAYGPVGSSSPYGGFRLHLSSGGITAVGSATATQSFDDKSYWSISRFSLDGGMLWNRTYYRDASFNSYGSSVFGSEVDAAGNIYLTGGLPKDSFGADTVFAKFSTQGDLQFVRLFPANVGITNYPLFLFEPNAANPTHILASADLGTSPFGSPGLIRFSNVANASLPITIAEGTPADQTVAVGDSVTFTVTTEGGTPWSYQWRKHPAVGAPQVIGGATRPSLTIANVQLADAVGYSVVAINGSGSVTSRVATLSAYVAIPLAEALDNNFTWSAGGNQPWRGRTGAGRNGDDGAVSGAIGHSGESTMQAAFNGPGVISFDWKVSSESGWDYLAVELDGTEVQRISGEADWQKAYVQVPAGNHALRWAYRKDGSAVSGSDAGYVDAVAFTAEADLVAPSITEHPLSQGVRPGYSATLRARATGSEPMSFQWFRNGAELNGQTSADLYLWGDDPEVEGSYHCVVTNLKGTATTNPAVIAISNDSQPPQVTVSSPANAASVTSAALVVSGTASDNEGIGEVSVQVARQDGTSQHVIANGTTSWQANVVLGPGLNELFVQARDTAGNYSDFAYRTVFYEAPVTLAVSASAGGTVMEIARGRAVPAQATSDRIAGERVTLQAKAESGQLFVGWQLNGQIVSAAPRYTFHVQQATSLAAVFIPNRWAELRGTYAGLILGADDLPSSTGYFSVTVAPTRRFTGKLRLGGLVFPVSGLASPDGQGMIRVAKRGFPVVQIQLSFDAMNAGSTIAGQITVADQPLANFTAERAPYDKRVNPAPMAGQYTMLMPDGAGVNGYATVNITTAGAVLLGGAMPDGAAWTHSTTISGTGRFPLFAAFGGAGTAAGFLDFTDNPGVSDFGGTLSWSKTATSPGDDLPAVGSAWKVEANQAVIPTIDTAGATLSFNGGNLAAAESFKVTVLAASRAKQLKVSLPIPNPQRLKVSVNSTTGLLTGSFVPTGARKPIPFKGVVFQEQRRGAGCFFNGAAVGEMTLGLNP